MPTLLKQTLRVALLLALASVPFAFFFMLLGGRPLETFPGYYMVALVFATVIGGLNVLTSAYVVPRLSPEGDSRGMAKAVAAHILVSLLGSALSGLTLDATLVPGMLGGPRGVAVFGMLSVLFTIMFVGSITAWQLWQRALARARSDQELLLARRIQRSFLIEQFPSHETGHVHAVNRSSREVSGDFYDVVRAGEHVLLVAIADVSGKGVPAALLSSMLQASLRTLAGRLESVSEITTALNSMVCQRESVGQFATFFLLRWDQQTHQIRYTNAGHNFPILLRADGSHELLEAGGLVVGMLEGMPYAEGTCSLGPGDRLLLYTDGVTEGESPSGEMYGEDRLLADFQALPSGLTAPAMVDALLAAHERFLAGREPGDDVTVMVLAREAQPASSPGSVVSRATAGEAS